MIERIDLFLPPRNRYHVLHALTHNLAEALERTGVRCRILEPESYDPQTFVEALLQNPPNCTLSFNGLLPDAEGNFFCDMTRIPHVAVLISSPYHFLSLTQSPHTIIAAVDLFTCDFFQGLNDRNVLFMPHAGDKNLFTNASTDKHERTFDILMLNSFVDYEAIRRGWHQQYPKPICEALEEAIEISLVEKETPYVHALAQTLNEHAKQETFDPEQIDFITLLDQFKDYMSGKERVAILKALEGMPVHIFGEGNEGWKKYLDKRTTHIMHPAVSYENALKLMRQTKILINSAPSIKNGAHERLFAGILSGAAVLTNETIFMSENFKHKKEILYYRYGQWNEMRNLLQEYVTNDAKRHALVKAGQQIVLEEHTWDHRAATLVNELEPILQRLSLEKK